MNNNWLIWIIIIILNIGIFANTYNINKLEEKMEKLERFYDLP